MFFHPNIISYCQQNRYVRLSIYTDLFTLIDCVNIWQRSEAPKQSFLR